MNKAAMSFENENNKLAVFLVVVGILVDSTHKLLSTSNSLEINILKRGKPNLESDMASSSILHYVISHYFRL